MHRESAIIAESLQLDRGSGQRVQMTGCLHSKAGSNMDIVLIKLPMTPDTKNRPEGRLFFFGNLAVGAGVGEVSGAEPDDTEVVPPGRGAGRGLVGASKRLQKSLIEHQRHSLADRESIACGFC
jgi:hypothetical protein